MKMDEIRTRVRLGLSHEERGWRLAMLTGGEMKQSDKRAKKPKKASGVGVTSVEGEGGRIDRVAAANAILW